MKKKIFRFLGSVFLLTFLAQLSAARAESLAPVFIALVAMLGVMLCFGLSEGTGEEKGADEDGN